MSSAEFILQPFRHFTYVTAHTPTFPSFTYVTAHSPNLPSLYLRHNSFSNPSVVSTTHRSFSNLSFASPTPQALHLRHLASRPCYTDSTIFWSFQNSKELGFLSFDLSIKLSLMRLVQHEASELFGDVINASYLQSPYVCQHR